MGKKDFDIEFDFEEEYGFDPKSFLGDEAYDDNIDLNAFSDEELGLTSRNKSEDEEDTAAEEENANFDLNEDLDLDDFLNMGSAEEDTEEEDPEAEETEADEAEYEEAAEDEEVYEEASEDMAAEEESDSDPDLLEDTEPEETDMDETMEYEEALEEDAYEEEAQEETFEFAEEEEDEPKPKRKPRQKKERKPIQLPKIKIKTPNIFTRFYDLYFAPVLDKNWQNPEDAKAAAEGKNSRRRRKTKAQVFKEVYLPPILCCVCLILVMSFLIGSLSNVIEQRRIDKDAEQSRLSESVSAAEQAEQASQAVAAEAAQLAAGYDYESAIEKLDSLGDLSQYPDLSTRRGEYVNAMSALVEYKDFSSIPNLSFHVLIEDMERALKDETYGGQYNRNFVSTNEFGKILQQLYDNGYVLVDFESFVNTKTDINGNATFESGSLWLPADKKPVMITETMVNYYAYMVDPDKDGVPDAKGGGFANKLVVDANGDIKAEYINAAGETLTGNYDLVPILEDFIKQHPDFSYRGARAIVAVTGDEGLFGYRCNTSYIANKGQAFYDEQVVGAQKVADALRAKGYTIASYTYANKKYSDLNSSQITAEMESWKQEVTAVIGAVDTFVFAKNSNLTDYNSTSLQVMMQNGFRYFISNANGTSDATTSINSTYIRQNRLMVTGNSMAWNSSWFTGLFNTNAVMDATVRGNVPN